MGKKNIEKEVFLTKVESRIESFWIYANNYMNLEIFIFRLNCYFYETTGKLC